MEARNELVGLVAHASQVTLGALVAALTLGLSDALAQAPVPGNTYVADNLIQAIPLDVEVTPNGRVAVVRATLPGSEGSPSVYKLTLWDTNTGQQVSITPPGSTGRGELDIHPNTGKLYFSDAVAVTNDRVVSIGSSDDLDGSGNPGTDGWEDTTYVDILELTYAGGVPQVTVLQRHVLAGDTDETRAGWAHDVAITPDGSMAVVTCENWVQVFNLHGGDLAAAINIGGDDTSLAGPCQPISSRNSVEVTNIRAIVVATRDGTLSPEAWVFIIDLSADPPELIGEYAQANPSSTALFQNAHDIAITPDGLRAVVTATDSVGLYNLRSGLRIAQVNETGGDYRNWNLPVHSGFGPDLWDSVELTAARAVVLSDTQDANPTWRARVYDISSGLSLLRTYTGEQAGDTAWDVALAIDGQMATIKTKEHDLALLNVPSSSTSASDLFWAGTHSLTGYPPPSGVTYPGTSSGMPGINDATALLYPVEGSPGHRWAAFLGDTGGTNQATMVFYDLVVANWGTTVPTQAFTVTDSHTGATVAPADLELGFDGSDVIARTSAPFDDSLQAGGPDWGRWGGTTPAQVDVTLGGRGVCTGRDSLRMSRNAAVSISRHPDPQTIQGWVHIVKCTYVTPFP